jgi:hypothetical protein
VLKSQKMARTHYDILGASKADSLIVIREKYHTLARSHHPDKCGGLTSQEFLDIQKAYETLMDATTREQYDNALMAVNQTMIQVETFCTDKPVVVWCTVNLNQMTLDDDCYCYPCRCGDEFDVLVEEVAQGSVYILPCPGCTLKLRLDTNT